MTTSDQATEDRVNRLSNIPNDKEKSQRIAPLVVTKSTSLDPVLLAKLAQSPVPKNGEFSTFDPVHLSYAAEIYKYFMERFTNENKPEQLDDILDDLAEAKLRLNETLFQYIFEVSLVHNQRRLPKDHPIHKILLPDVIDRLPFKYVTSNQIQRLTSPDQNGQKAIDEKNFHDTGTPVDPENKVAWYREDPWWNSHHWHWHVIYPAPGVLNPDTGKMETKDRQGELFYYMHQQMLARYDTERMGAGLARVVPYKDFRQPMPGYNANLIATSGKFNYGPRSEGFIMPTIRPNMQYDMIEQEVRRQRIFDAIDQGYFEHIGFVTLPDGTQEAVRKYTAINIDLLGATVEANAASIEKISNENTFYGSLHNLGHRLIAAAVDPLESMNWPKGVMSDVATAIRDPMFWRWHRFVDDTVTRWINKQPKNPFAQGIKLPGDETLFITSASVLSIGPPNVARNPGHLYTTMETYAMNFLHVSPVNDQNYNMTAEIKRINYEPFNYSFDVENTGDAKDVTVRVWIVPYLREIGMEGLDRRLFIEMDRFEVHLEKGKKTIRRSSESSTLLQSPKLEENELFDQQHVEVRGDSEDFCYCGVPRHMLLPRGKKGNVGYKFKLFVMISDAAHDRIEGAHDRCGSVYCGLQNKKYPVKREMGYPFNRLLQPDLLKSDEQALLDIIKNNPNMHLSDIYIHWVGAQHINILRSLKLAHKQRKVPESGKNYFIVNASSDKGFEVKDESTSDVAPIVQNTIVGTRDSQRFHFTDAGDGFYTISALHSKKNLDITGSGQKVGTPLIQYTPHTSPNQRFKLLQSTHYHFHIAAKHSNKYLTFQGDGVSDGASIIQGDLDATQSWRLILAPLNKWPISVARQTREFVVRAQPTSTGVVHGHPRVVIPIEPKDVDESGAVSSSVTVRNTATGKKIRIYGVNHWVWGGNELYVWPVYDSFSFSDAVLEHFKQVVFVGAKINVVVK
eukprot:TRINITY_DN249_c0_g1_i2.p1 TRINITY_DN249_c0_g1~~TRINITY_DN249_c0_g1_i2.p1  ORF type:complete len:963 (+),score=219.50 TRINITY_DN249_c0_g1_i2:75-2963(+)